MLDAHLIAQRYSRLVIDCNRPPHVASSIPLISEATTIPGNEGIDARSRAKRGGAQIFDPYHRRIEEIIDAPPAATGMPTVLVSLHSFTPVYAGIARPWHIGTLYHRDTRLPPLLLKLLRAEADLVVGDNEPYAVSDETDYTIPVHGEVRGLMNTGIEIRQDLISDQAGEKQWAEPAGADLCRDRNDASGGEAAASCLTVHRERNTHLQGRRRRRTTASRRSWCSVRALLPMDWPD